MGKVIITITNDTTEKKSAKEELEKQKLIGLHQSKLASIGELAAGVGHEINNPLTIVEGYIAVLQKKIEIDKVSKEEIQ